MNLPGGHRHLVVAGLILGVLLLAGCGMQSSQRASALDPLAAGPGGAQVVSFEALFEQPAAQPAPEVAITSRQPELRGMALPQSKAPTLAAAERMAGASSQALAHAAGAHHCSGFDD